MKAKRAAADRPTPQPVTPHPAPPPTPGRRRFRLPLYSLLFVTLFVAVGGGVAWYVLTRDVPPNPPLPTGITEEEVRTTLEAARAKLLETPRDGGAWGEYGTVLLANLFDKDAVACFLEAEKRSPDDPRWPYARGQVALKRDPENALLLLEAAAEAAKTSRTYKQAFNLTLAETLLERGQIDRAEALYLQHLTPPDPERAEYGLGLVAVSRGDREAALRHFLAAVRHPSCRKQATAQLARLSRAMGDVAAAKQYEAEAGLLEQDPPWPDPYLDRAVTLQVGSRGRDRRVAMLELDGRFREAADQFLKMAEEKRTSQALTGAGVNLARLAKQSAERGRYDEMLARYDEAVARLREAVQIDPKDTNAQYTLALVLFNKWERVAGTDPKAAGLADGFREVVARARATAELKPDHYKALLFWGLALKNQGEFRAAIDPLQRGLTVAPNEFELQLALGQVLAAAGDRAEAKERFLTARRLNANDPRPDQELRKLGD